ncbi:HpcH/HpaI aldolase/citrate lyase family protein [Sphingomonas radiodurans]|uniref:HpcH/HpaI aldolase/citrate lyase family protein n=1 Tax=Sphingomonas radiodurans TaxID=2890321 RepID=UPI001E35F9F7|nr:CoA ester lyase [Sphingomonas radiodurans]WBH17747.1 CoA ester lyase [Sphingomonas radiodurans]
MTIRPRRSALYMPASNARAIEKARSLECDVVILDLEDAVAPEQKAAARAQAVAAGGFGHREWVIRANGLDTEWGADDLAAITGAGCDAVLIPKVSDPATLHAAREKLGPGPALWAMIETAQAIVDLRAIGEAAAETGLTAFVVGPNDLAKELRLRPGVDRAPLLPILSQIVTVARAYRIVPLDGVMNAFDDEAAIEAECRQGLAFGFDGKTLIHPNQIAPANRVFAPSDDEVAWAQTIVAAFDAPENVGKGAIKVEGKMVELLHRDDARRTLALAAAIRR